MQNVNRRLLLAGMAAMVSSRAFGGEQQSFPTRPINIIVPATAGGGADIGARRVGELLRDAWGQPVIIDNRAGAAGSIAAAYVSRAEKDGYTVGMASDSSVLINPLVMPDLNYKLESFELISTLYMGGMALAVSNDFPAKTVEQFVAVVNRRGSLTCAMFGSVSSPRLAAETLMSEAQIKLAPVPYRGETEAVRDLIGGIVPCFFGTTANLFEQHRGGTLRVLGVSSAERIPVLPDVPTFAEVGLKTVNYRWFHGLMLPGGTEERIIDRYSRALQPIITSEQFKKGMNPDVTPVYMAPSEFKELAYAARERAIKIIHDSDLKQQ
jgi:tripartite-type tricarboxylate transporter receptor subunit TctC